MHVDTVQAMQTPVEASFVRGQEMAQQQALAESPRLRNRDQERAQAVHLQVQRNPGARRLPAI